MLTEEAAPVASLSTLAFESTLVTYWDSPLWHRASPTIGVPCVTPRSGRAEGRARVGNPLGGVTHRTPMVGEEHVWVLCNRVWKPRVSARGLHRWRTTRLSDFWRGAVLREEGKWGSIQDCCYRQVLVQYSSSTTDSPWLGLLSFRQASSLPRLVVSATSYWLAIVAISILRGTLYFLHLRAALASLKHLDLIKPKVHGESLSRKGRLLGCHNKTSLRRTV